jgi:hypothetical protein
VRTQSWSSPAPQLPEGQLWAGCMRKQGPPRWLSHMPKNPRSSFKKTNSKVSTPEFWLRKSGMGLHHLPCKRADLVMWNWYQDALGNLELGR